MTIEDKMRILRERLEKLDRIPEIESKLIELKTEIDKIPKEVKP